MKEWERQRWNWLCNEAANENDPVRFIQLTEEIVRMLQKEDGETRKIRTKTNAISPQNIWITKPASFCVKSGCFTS